MSLKGKRKATQAVTGGSSLKVAKKDPSRASKPREDPTKDQEFPTGACKVNPNPCGRCTQVYSKRFGDADYHGCDFDPSKPGEGHAEVCKLPDDTDVEAPEVKCLHCPKKTHYCVQLMGNQEEKALRDVMKDQVAYWALATELDGLKDMTKAKKARDDLEKLKLRIKSQFQSLYGLYTAKGISVDKRYPAHTGSLVPDYSGYYYTDPQEPAAKGTPLRARAFADPHTPSQRVSTPVTVTAGSGVAQEDLLAVLNRTRELKKWMEEFLGANEMAIEPATPFSRPIWAMTPLEVKQAKDKAAEVVDDF